MKSIQYVVQTTTKRSGYGWESYNDTKEDAIAYYNKAVKDKSFATVRIYWQGWADDGSWKSGSIEVEK